MSNHRDELYYSSYAKTRIRELGVSELNRFLLSIQRQKLDKWLLSALPKLNGFRSTGSVAADEQRRRLLARLTSREQKQTEDRDWHLFKHLWLTWARETINGDELLEYLEKFDRGQLEDSKATEDVQETIHQKLKSLIDARELARESLIDFLQFAPFDTLVIFDNLISSAVSRSALEREKVVESLPARLTALEAELTRTSTLARDRSELDILRDEITQLQTLANANEAACEAAKQEHNRQVVALEQAKQDLKAHLAILDATTQTQVQRIGVLMNEDRSKSAELFALRELFQSSRELLHRLSEEFKSSLQSRGSVPNGEGRGSPHSNALEAEAIQQPAATPRSKIRFAIYDTIKTEVEPINDLTALLDLLGENLSSIGLLGSSADAVALDVVAAASSGQLISFSGSMARPLIDLLMRTFASSWSIASVPIGLMSDDDLSDLLASSDVKNLTLLSSNASAFEIYGQPLRQCLLSAGSKRLNLTLVEIISGPGALPIIPSYCDLGPIICSDYLLWTNSPRRPSTRSCEFDRNAFAINLSEAEDSDDEVFQQFVGLQKNMPVSPSAALRRSLFQAAKVLRECEVPHLSRIASLMVSWLIPSATASGLTIIEIRDLISRSDAKESLEDNRVRSVLQIK